MTGPTQSRHGEEGYLLLWLVVVCFLLLLALGVAAPRAAKELERDREVESEHRAQEYVRAIQLYYRKNNSYPTSIDQLLGNGATGSTSIVSVKYLRQRYKDPLTHDDFRLIHLGEAKTEVKGFFGEPLQGVPVGSLGSVAGSQSNLAGGSNFGSSTTAASGAGASTLGSSGAAFGAPTTNAAAPPSAGAGGMNGSSALGSTGTPAAGSGSTPFGGSGTSATSFQGSKGGIIGVGSYAKGPGLVEWNGSADIGDWEFLYDPRVEALKAKVSLFGGTPAASGSGTLGGGFAPVSGATGNVGNAPAGFGSTATPSNTGGAGVSTPTTGSPTAPNTQ